VARFAQDQGTFIELHFISYLIPHASPSPQQSSAFPVQSMSLLPQLSASSSTLQELASDGAVDFSLLILR